MLNFEKVELERTVIESHNVFANYKDSTLGQTLEKQTYKRLANLFLEETEQNRSRRLGDFLLDLKNRGDERYRKFLNAHGDKTYLGFKISDEEVLTRTGIYCFLINSEIQYIGITHASFEKRINDGYGKIHPKNCFIDGQPTNCHVNSQIFSLLSSHSFSEIEFYVHIFEDLEKELIQKYQPPWNISLKRR